MSIKTLNICSLLDDLRYIPQEFKLKQFKKKIKVLSVAKYYVRHKIYSKENIYKKPKV